VLAGLLPLLAVAVASPAHAGVKPALERQEQRETVTLLDSGAKPRAGLDDLAPPVAEVAVRPPEGGKDAQGDWPWQYADWLAALRVEALAEGISPATFDAALAGVAPLPEVLASDRNQPELKLGLEAYLGRLITDQRVATGRDRLQRHHQLLLELQARYGVEPNFLVALWGAESDYGRVTGNLPVVAALVTLAFDPRRAAYFRQELLATLHLLQEHRVTLSDLRGSWAGAMGGLQFMPSVYRRFALDYYGDGQVDIWREPGDLLATGAAYLASLGWCRGQGWGCEVKLTRPIDPGLLGHGQRLSLAQWRELGVRTLDGREVSGPEQGASLIIPDAASGRAFLVYENFRVLRKWNRSDLYALSVSLLAERLGGR
jgi:membrane-bound lytic murein transglycosylase B